MDRKAIQKEVREYITENFLLDENEEELADDESFLDSGLIDSTGILEVVMFLEEHYSIDVEDEEMTPDNLDSVEKIATFVGSKLDA